jgi:predicted ATPase
MIQVIELKNFKAIKKHRFHLGNLNIMLGLNGMGKSTFIQSLLLLRQSENLSRGELRLNGNLVEIGKGADAFYQFSKEDKMTFNVSFTNRKQKNFEFVYEKDADYFKTLSVELTDRDFFQESLFLNKFQYLSASRIDPKVIHDKSYKMVVDLHNVGDHGQYTAHFLHTYGNDDITFKNLKHSSADTLLLREQVNRWMGEISTGVKFNTTEISNSDNILLDMQFVQPNLGFTSKFRPTNVGFGISYALPVVTALLAAKPRELIIIENPESHIHPRGQAELGKLMARVAMNDVQLIVETHSDHILNGIRVAVKEQEITEDRLRLFYFERKIEDTEQYSKITNIEIDKNGELSSYPKNLLDEWSNQLIKLV